MHEPWVRGEPRLCATADDQSAHSVLRGWGRKRYWQAKEYFTSYKTAGQSALYVGFGDGVGVVTRCLGSRGGRDGVTVGPGAM